MTSTPPFPVVAQRKRKVLIVDDDRINLRILAGFLKMGSYEICEANSGERALVLYEEEKPDMVLLDVMLPGIDGLETCRRLKEKFGETCAPVIFITGRADANDVIAGLAAGGVDYLPKPFRPSEAMARIRTHLQNRQLLEEQKILIDQLSAANMSKNKFLGMAAHDLRNPLSSIRGLAELLKEGMLGELNADQLDLINSIHAASQSMLLMVNELLDVATIEAGELRIVKAPSNLADLIDKSVYLNNITAVQKKTIIARIPSTGTEPVDLDSAKFRQVLDNLLSNGVKYSPPGSTITIEEQWSAGHVAVIVKDQGPGIPESERHKLFKDFGTTSIMPTGGEKSTGLGLAICRKIIDAHNGSIKAENLPERGCAFIVKIPISSP